MRITTKTASKTKRSRELQVKLVRLNEKRAANSKQLGYIVADDIVAEAHLPKKLLDMRARQGIKLARGVDAGEEETCINTLPV